MGGWCVRYGQGGSIGFEFARVGDRKTRGECGLDCGCGLCCLHE